MPVPVFVATPPQRVLACDAAAHFPGMDNCHPLAWLSRKCTRVVSSIFAGEAIACATVYELAFTIRLTLYELLGYELPLFLFTDSYSLFSTITKFPTIREKRLSIDLAELRQEYRRREVANFGFVRTQYMLADTSTKIMESEIITTLMTTGKMSHPDAEYIVADDALATGDVRFLFASMP